MPNCLHMIFFVLFYCGRREYLTSLQVCYSHQGIGIVKWYWDCHLLCNNKNTPVTNRTVTYRFCLQRLDFNVVSSTGWRCNKLQMEFIWIDLEKILSKQVELWVEGKECCIFWCFGLWLHLLAWLLTLWFHVFW